MYRIGQPAQALSAVRRSQNRLITHPAFRACDAVGYFLFFLLFFTWTTSFEFLSRIEKWES